MRTERRQEARVEARRSRHLTPADAVSSAAHAPGMRASAPDRREIAQALFVTPRTVEVHLTNAYRKLGISSRSDLAAALSGVKPARTRTGEARAVSIHT